MLQPEDVRLFWNYPQTPTSGTDFDNYCEIEWLKNSTVSEGYDFITVEREIDTAGTYHFFYTIDGR